MKLLVEVKSFRELLDVSGVSNADIARAIGCSKTYVTHKIQGRRHWFDDDLEPLTRTLRNAPRPVVISETELRSMLNDVLEQRYTRALELRPRRRHHVAA